MKEMKTAPGQGLPLGFQRLRAIFDLFAMLVRGRRPWLLPLVVVLLGVAGLLTVVQLAEYVAPFVYTLF